MAQTPPVEFCRRQQINILKYLLRLCVSQEVNQLKTDPTVQHLENFPFLDFFNKVWVRTFPWVQKEGETFWSGIEDLLKIHASLKPASAYRDDSSLDRICDRITNIVVLLFKNTLRPLDSNPKLEEKRDEEAYREWKELQKEIGLPTVVVHSNKPKEQKNDFKLKILTSRRTEDSSPSPKPYEVFVIESSYKDKIGRVSHRFSEFLLLHEVLAKNFPEITLPTPPRKHRFSKHTDDFIENRRRDLEVYLKALCEIQQIRDSGEIHGFLLVGETTELTVDEKAIEDEKERNLAYANATFSELIASVKTLLSTEEGIKRLYNLYPTLKAMPNFDAMPADYGNILRLSKTVAAYSLYYRFHCQDICEQNIQTAKLLYRLTPFTAIRGILSIANPVGLLQDLANIFLKKPLNMKNLAQLMISETANQKVGFNEAARKSAISSVQAPSVCEKVFKVVNDDEALSQCYEGLSGEMKDEAIRNILVLPTVEPIIHEEIVREITEDPSKLEAVKRLLEIELRQSDIRKMVEFCGDDQVIQIIQTLISIFFKPLAAAYQSAEIGSLLVIIKKSISKIISIAENRSQSSSSAFAAYREVIDAMERPLFDFVHQIIQNDDGAVEDTIRWFLALVDKIRKDRADPYSIDFSELISELYPYQFETLEQELKQLDDMIFRKKYLRKLRYKALKEYQGNQEGDLSLVGILSDPGQSDGVDMGHQLGVSGFISDDDLEDLSDHPFAPPGDKQPNKTESIPSLHILTSLAPKFIEQVNNNLFAHYEDFIQ